VASFKSWRSRPAPGASSSTVAAAMLRRCLSRVKLMALMAAEIIGGGAVQPGSPSPHVHGRDTGALQVETGSGGTAVCSSRRRGCPIGVSSLWSQLGRTRGVAPSKHRDLSRGKLGLAIEDVEVIGDGREAIGSVCHCGPAMASGLIAASLPVGIRARWRAGSSRGPTSASSRRAPTRAARRQGPRVAQRIGARIGATRPTSPRSGAARGSGPSDRPRSGAGPARSQARQRRDPLRPAAVPLRLAALRCAPLRSRHHLPA